MAFAGLAKGPVAADAFSAPAALARSGAGAAAGRAAGGEAEATLARLEESRSRLLELEQLVWRAQSSVRGVRQREDAIRRECGEHERRLRHLDREHEAAREDFQAENVEPLRRSEAQASDRLRREQAAEREARKAVERLRARILDLSGDCGSVLLGSAAAEATGLGSERAKVLALLRAALPAAHPARRMSDVNDLLATLESERADVQAALLNLPRAGSGQGRTLEALREETAALQKQVQKVEVEVRRKERRAEDLRSEAAAATADARADAEDVKLEAAGLRRETELWRRQQAEWERSQARMLHLTGDLQGLRDAGAQRQALVAKRLRELKREQSPAEGRGGGGSARGALDRIRAENGSLERQIQSLERERAELLRKKEGLVSFVSSRLSELHEATPGGGATDGDPSGHGCYPPSP